MARILVVDDHADTTLLYKALLSLKGHEVHAACAFDDARATARRVMPDLAICDWELITYEGGLELAQTLCAELPDLRLLFLSGHAPERLWPRVKRLRVAGILQKPIAAEELHREVERALMIHPAGCGTPTEPE